MNAIWNFLNGNKTIFGLALVSFAQALPADTILFDIPIVPILNWLGGILTGTGVVHKALKSNTQPGPNA